MRVLAWPGMPDPHALERAHGGPVELEVVSSNERLYEQMGGGLEPFDLVFPSDYLVERLRQERRLIALDAGRLPLERLEPWAVEAVHDPGCAHSVPFAYGTTGILRGAGAAIAGSWAWLFAPPPGAAIGMLDELREVVGAALIAAGHSPNDTSQAALDAARVLLLAQRPSVDRYDSDDFCTPVINGRVLAHQAWSGPAARVVRCGRGLSYVVPPEGAGLWTTAAAIPAGAPDPDRSLELLVRLMDPELAALTTARHGYATPNRAARALLPAAIREDPALFPDSAIRARCHVFRDLGDAERRFEAVWAAVRAPSSD
jgi:spermidine/putrescine transport system substrate-binding protein